MTKDLITACVPLTPRAKLVLEHAIALCLKDNSKLLTTFHIVDAIRKYHISLSTNANNYIGRDNTAEEACVEHSNDS